MKKLADDIPHEKDKSMALSAVRHRRILELLEETAELHVNDLSAKLDVSPETIRRDLRLLEQKGALRRVHGGAVLYQEVGVQPYQERMTFLSLEKESIAEQTVQLDVHRGGQTIFIGGGSTMLALAKRLAAMAPATFVTNTIDVAVTLKGRGMHNVILTGGHLQSGHELLTGSYVLETVSRFKFDVAFTSANAVDHEVGLLDRLESESLLHRLISRHSTKYIVAVDHSKFRMSAPFASVPLSEIHVLVTDRRPPEVFGSRLQSAGVQVVYPE